MDAPCATGRLRPFGLLKARASGGKREVREHLPEGGEGKRAGGSVRQNESGKGRARDFAGEVGNGDGGEVVEGKRFCASETGKFGDVGPEGEKSDVAKGYGMSGFFDANERELVESREGLVGVFAQFRFGVLVNLNRREVPHSGQQSGNLGRGAGFPV